MITGCTSGVGGSGGSVALPVVIPVLGGAKGGVEITPGGLGGLSLTEHLHRSKHQVQATLELFFVGPHSAQVYVPLRVCYSSGCSHPTCIARTHGLNRHALLECSNYTSHSSSLKATRSA